MKHKEFVDEFDDQEFMIEILKYLNEIQDGLCSDNEAHSRTAFINLGMLIAWLRINLQINEEKCKADLHKDGNEPSK